MTLDITQDKSLRKRILIFLTVLMAIRIASYFTLFPDSVAVTRVVKISLRFLTTLVAAGLLLWGREIRPGKSFEYGNVVPTGLYVMYLTLGMASVAWSSSFGYSLLQLAMTTESLFFCFYFYKLTIRWGSWVKGDVRYSYILHNAIFILGTAFVIGLFVDPDTFFRQTHGGEVSRLGGFIINPNELGMLAVLGASMAFMEGKDVGYSKNVWLSLIMAVAVLLLTQSRSSLGAFLMVAGYFLLMTKNIKLIFSAAVAGMMVLPIALKEIVFKQGNVEEVMSMTGRLPFWTDLLSTGFPREPLLGYGFMRIDYHDKFDSIHAYAASMTHNTFIQVLLNLGLVGMFIVTLQMAYTFYAMFILKDRYIKEMAFVALIPLIINSITEFGIFGESNYGIMFYQFILMSLMITLPQKKTTLA